LQEPAIIFRAPPGSGSPAVGRCNGCSRLWQVESLAFEVSGVVDRRYESVWRTMKQCGYAKVDGVGPKEEGVWSLTNDVDVDLLLRFFACVGDRVDYL
jgi:hypothetical protein